MKVEETFTSILFGGVEEATDQQGADENTSSPLSSNSRQQHLVWTVLSRLDDALLHDYPASTCVCDGGAAHSHTDTTFCEHHYYLKVR